MLDHVSAADDRVYLLGSDFKRSPSIAELKAEEHKRPTLLFKKKWKFPGGLVYLYLCYHLTCHAYHIYRSIKLINGPIAATSNVCFDVRAFCTFIT